MQIIESSQVLEIDQDRWLTEVLGYPVFTIAKTDHLIEADSLREVFATSEKSIGRALYYTKVDTDQNIILNDFQAVGMQVVDVNVTLEQSAHEPYPKLKVTETQDGRISIVSARDVPCDALLKIAKNSFKHSRFHSDPLIDNQLADQTREAWLKSYLDGVRGDQLFAAVKNGSVAGFLAATFDPDQRVAVIDLMAVGSEFRGTGVGHQLVITFVEHYASRCDVYRVGSQIVNQPAIRLYHKCGFNYAKSAYVLHKHILSSV